jgi:type IV secretion system protein VirB6
VQIAEKLFTNVDGMLASSATSLSSTISGILAPIAVLGLSIYFSVQAFAIWRGDVQEPMSKLTKDFLKIALVVGIALPGGAYQSWVVDGLNGIQSLLISTVTGSSSANVGAAIDRANAGCMPLPVNNTKAEWAQCVAYSDILMAAAMENSTLGIPDLSYVLAHIVVALAQVVISLCCIIPVILAKIGFVVAIALGPICILMLLWPPTQNYFTSWLSLVLGFAFTLVIISIIVSLIPNGFAYFIGNAQRNFATNESHVMGDALVVLVVGVGLGLSAIQASNMATQLVGGGVSLNTAGLAGSLVQSFLTRTLFKSAQGGGKGEAGAGATGGGAINQSAPPLTRAATAAGSATGRVLSNINNAIRRK